MVSGAQAFVVAWTPLMLSRSSSIASTAATTTGKYAGLQPAITAFAATDSMVATPWRGGTMPITSAGSRSTAAIISATASSVGGITGRPSVQPFS